MRPPGLPPLYLSVSHSWAEQTRKQHTQHNPLSHLLSISYSQSSADMLAGCEEKKNRNENTSWELNGSVYILLLCCRFYFLNSLDAEEVLKELLFYSWTDMFAALLQYIFFNTSTCFCHTFSHKFDIFHLSVNISVFLNLIPGCFYRFVWPGGSFENLVSGLHRLHHLLPAQVWVSSSGGHHAAHLPRPVPLPVHLLSGMDSHARTHICTLCCWTNIYMCKHHTQIKNLQRFRKSMNPFLAFLSWLR